MKQNAHILQLFFCALFSLLVMTETSLAQETEDRGFTNKVIIALEQNTLSQRIAKASCYIGTYSEVDEHLTILKQAIEKFEGNLYSLQFGNYAADLDGERDLSVLSLLNNVESTWNFVHFSADMTQDLPQNPGLDIDLMSGFNIDLLFNTQQYLDKLLQAEKYKTPYLNTVYHIGELALLLQKATKEFCYISYGLKIDEHRKLLDQSAKAFDEHVRNLVDGNLEQSILAAPNKNIKNQLIDIEFKWQTMRGFFQNAADGKTAHTREFKIISNFNEPLLKQINETLRLFVAAYHEYKASEAE